MISKQRQTNYWEPVFNPSQSELAVQELTRDDFKNKNGWKDSTIDLRSFLESEKRYNNCTFTTVDFKGTLKPEKTESITFYNCTFTNVSFSGTIFKNIKFQKCTFEKTTFSLSTFDSCEFRDCNYINIGISGNTTIFKDSYIDSKELLKNVFLNQDK